MSDAGVQASIHKNRKTTLSKIVNYISSSKYKDVNLYEKKYDDVRPVSISYWALPGGEGAWQEWTFNEVIQQNFTPVELGGSYGPTWTTHWFKIDYEIPPEWENREVRFRWGSDTEATLWSSDGRVLQGLSTGTLYMLRNTYVLSRNASPSTGTLYVEMVASRLFGVGGLGDNITPTDNNHYFTLSRAEIVTVDTEVQKLIRDIDVLSEVISVLGEDDPRSYMALYSTNQMINNIIKGDKSGASALADLYFSKGNGARVHTLAAIGNCHIDTAWLWPYSETKRKVARSYASQLKIIEDYPEHVFVASQAQQWAWLKQYYPELFARVKEQVSGGQFLPVGTTWVEMDGNIPSGESFIRQFFYGQKFYEKELDYVCNEYWLPDTFGYSAQIPGLMRHMGLGRFLTQKLSWNSVNKFPHHSFTWEGIDGSTVLAHFPPGDSYTLNVNLNECMHTVKNLEDKGRVSTSAFLFGYGDGGGGPTEEMLERARRIKDIDGFPKFEIVTPDDLFTKLESEQHNMMRWVGELFLELHNGTYTSQAAMKRLCRKSEFALRDAEFMLTSAVIKVGSSAADLQQNMMSLEEAWKKVLLNQFHDVLPGSGIGIIYPQATKLYQEAIQTARDVRDMAASAMFGSGASRWVGLNTLQWQRREVASVTNKLAKNANLDNIQRTQDGVEYALVQTPSFGYSDLTPVTPNNPVVVTRVGDDFNLNNGLINVTISSFGHILSLQVVGDNRDVFSTKVNRSGNHFILYDDEPVYYDAWDVADYHLESSSVLNVAESGLSITPVTIKESGPIVASLEWSMNISGESHLTQTIELAADSNHVTFNTHVDWHENHKILKVLFDTNLLARSCSYDIQFGFIERPTHMNTSWDSARYEVCGHKWANLAEPDWGLCVMNESKYGWMSRGHVLTLSLLKSPKNPDDMCDMGGHSFKYAVMPHTGSLQSAEVMRRAYEFNNPLEFIQIPSDAITADPNWSWGTVEGEGVVLDTVKPADDYSSDVILRMFESHGNQTDTVIKINTAATSVITTNGREQDGEACQFTVTNDVTSIPLSFTPFQIRAIKVSTA